MNRFYQRRRTHQKMLIFLVVLAINIPLIGLGDFHTSSGKVEMIYNADCEGGIKIIPTEPTSCGGTGEIDINYQGSNTGDYESRIGGSGSWSSGNQNYNGLSAGEYLVEVRNIASPNELCRSFVVTLYYEGDYYSSLSTMDASGCYDADGGITLIGASTGDEVCWISALTKTWVPISSLAGNTITGLVPGDYLVSVRDAANPYCIEQELVTVGNSGAGCPTPTLCSTTLGANRFTNGDFGRGTEVIGPPLTSSQTKYAFVKMSCDAPDDGTYTIVSETDCDGGNNGIFGGAFDVLPHDHTLDSLDGPDSVGYMMLVNASYAPDIVYEKEIPGLCSNTEYQFSAWIYNIQASAPIKPNLTFQIDGIGRYTTGDILAAGWQQIGFTFNSSSATSADFSIRNNNQGGHGNDWIIDDIFVGICEPEVTVSPVQSCVGEIGVIASATVDDPQHQFSWYKWQYSTDGGSSWVDISSAAEASFSGDSYTVNYNLPSPIPSSFGGRLIRINVATSSGNLGSEVCSAISEGVLSIGNTEVSISSSASACVGDPLTLSSTVIGDASDVTYQWQVSNTLTGTYSNVPSSGTSSTYSVPTGTPSSQFYRVIVVNDMNGCEAATSDISAVDVKAFPGSTITGNSTICAGDNTTLTASVGDTYLWSNSATSQSITVSPTTNTTYSVTVTNAGSCSTPASQLVDVISVDGGNIGSDENVCTGGVPNGMGN